MAWLIVGDGGKVQGSCYSCHHFRAAKKSLLPGRWSVQKRFYYSLPLMQFPPFLLVNILLIGSVFPGNHVNCKVTVEKMVLEQRHIQNKYRNVKLFSCFLLIHKPK
jgi:hypothetical protein